MQTGAGRGYFAIADVPHYRRKIPQRMERGVFSGILQGFSGLRRICGNAGGANYRLCEQH